MAILKRPAQFQVPTMVDTDPEFASRVERLTALQSALQQLTRDQRRLERELDEMPAPKVSASVAALLGDAAVDARQVKVRELAETRRAIVDHETAITLQTTRVEQAKTAASRAVCEAVKPEYRRRVANLATTIQAAVDARSDFMALVAELEADGVSWRYLGDAVPHFLGDPQDGQAVRWLREMKGAGYV